MRMHLQSLPPGVKGPFSKQVCFLSLVGSLCDKQMGVFILSLCTEIDSPEIFPEILFSKINPHRHVPHVVGMWLGPVPLPPFSLFMLQK